MHVRNLLLKYSSVFGWMNSMLVAQKILIHQFVFNSNFFTADFDWVADIYFLFIVFFQRTFTLRLEVWDHDDALGKLKKLIQHI